MKIITGKNETIEQITLTAIHPDPENRKVGGFNEEHLQELARSIKSIGVQQPIIIRRNPKNAVFDLVAGERRWRASKLAGLETIPAVIRDLSDADVLHIQVIENIQREDLHPLDECNGFFRLLSGPIAYTILDIANEVGKSESYVSQRLRLKNLIPKAVEAFEENNILLGHAILIARLESDDQKKALNYALPGQYDSLSPVKYLRQWIEREIYLNLTKAAFPKKAENLIKGAGSCLNCRKRTDWDPALFPEINDEAFCLDAKCFNQKVEKHLENQKEIERPYIAGDWNYQTPEGDAYRQHEVTRWDPEWEEPEYEGEVPDKLTFEECLVVTGPERGKVVLAKIKSDDNENEDPEEVKRRKAERREDDIGRRQFEIFNKKVFQGVIEKLKVTGFQIDSEIMKMIIGMLFSDNYFYRSSFTLKAYNIDTNEPEEIVDKIQSLTNYNLREFIIQTLVESLIPQRWEQEEDTKFKDFAVDKGVDTESLEHEARLEAEAEYKEDHPEVIAADMINNKTISNLVD